MKSESKFTLSTERRNKKIVFNAKVYEKEKDVEIRDFLKYTLCEQSSGKFTAEINEIINRLKQAKSIREEVMFMSNEIQYHALKARKEGMEEDKKETALRMLKDNELSEEKISLYTALPLEEIHNLRKSL